VRALPCLSSKSTPTISRRHFLLSTAAIAASLSCQTRRAPSKPPNVVVFLADSLRADHLGCYGHKVQCSPAVDALARESIVFDRCYSQCCWTRPSIASIFTGYLPDVHEAGNTEKDFGAVSTAQAEIVRPCFTTLAEQFKQRGYNTGYLLSNAYLQKQFGFARGFDHYQYQDGWPPAELVNAAVEWLKKEAKEPFFLFIHEIDPHQPYYPHPEYYQELFGTSRDEAAKALTPEDVAEMKRMRQLAHWVDADDATVMREGFVKAPLTRPVYSPAAQSYFKNSYDAEILGVDREFGRMVKTIGDLGMDDRTAVVFTSDHGESFGEDGWYEHGNSLHNPELRVPLVLRLPAWMRESKRVPQTVSLFDLYPTLVALAGGKVDDKLQAKTLLDPDGSLAVDTDRECYATRVKPGQDASQGDQSLIHGPWKVRVTNPGEQMAVYNLDEDPQETRNYLAAGRAPLPAAAQQAVDRFKQARKQHIELAASFGKPEWVAGDESLKEELGALGYL
jgi:arylsulfatase A-like enzyme